MAKQLTKEELKQWEASQQRVPIATVILQTFASLVAYIVSVLLMLTAVLLSYKAFMWAVSLF